MTDLRDLKNRRPSDSVPPDINELWVRGRRRQHRRRLVTAASVLIVVAVGVGLIATVGGGESAVEVAATGQEAPPARVWVIPTFLDEPLEALQILTETSSLPDHSASLERLDDPKTRIGMFRNETGVFGDTGTPIDINGVTGFVQVPPGAPPGATPIVDIEWRVDGLWQIFQVITSSESDALDAARSYQAGGIESLTSLGWQVIDEPAPQETTTIIGLMGGLIFQNEPADSPAFETAIAESNGFTVYSPDPRSPQLFVAYKGRIVFSYGPASGRDPIDPAVLADHLKIVSKQKWQDWIDTWSVEISAATE